MLGDLENESVLNTLDFKSIENWWKVSLELDIDNGTDDLRDLTNSNDFGREVSYTIANMVRSGLNEKTYGCHEALPRVITFISFANEHLIDKSCLGPRFHDARSESRLMHLLLVISLESITIFMK
jgi:hypothetical protein